MIRTVLDTNVWVSGVLSPGNPPAIILEFALTGKIRLITSPGIIREVVRVFQYPKVKKALEKHRVTSREVEDVFLKLAKMSIITAGEKLVEAVLEDPVDNMVISCALEGRADFIISGDHHLTDLENYQGIKIIAPADFLELMAKLGEQE